MIQQTFLQVKRNQKIMLYILSKIDSIVLIKSKVDFCWNDSPTTIINTMLKVLE
jgi:hypothetical protein